MHTSSNNWYSVHDTLLCVTEPLSSTSTAASSSASVLSTMTVGKASPEVIQLSKGLSPKSGTPVPESVSTAVPCSFTTVKLHDILSKATDSSAQTDPVIKPLKTDSSTTRTCSTSVQVTSNDSVTPPPVSSGVQSNVQSSSRASKGQPSFTQLSQNNHIHSHSPPIIAMARQPQPSSSLKSAPITAIALQPGHHVLKPSQGVPSRGITVTPVTSPVSACTSGSQPSVYQSSVASTR